MANAICGKRCKRCFQANYGMSPTYHECTAKATGMNIIAFSVVGGTITVPAVGPRTDLPFVHGETVILGPITIAGTGAPHDTAFAAHGPRREVDGDRRGVEERPTHPAQGQPSIRITARPSM